LLALLKNGSRTFLRITALNHAEKVVFSTRNDRSNAFVSKHSALKNNFSHEQYQKVRANASPLFRRLIDTEKPVFSLLLPTRRQGVTADAPTARQWLSRIRETRFWFLLVLFTLACELPAWRLASIGFDVQGLDLARPASHQSSHGLWALARSDAITSDNL